jgi:hypothetical protein
MSHSTDAQAFCLANTYGFNPPRVTNPRYKRLLDTGKYEPDHNEGAASRTIILAHWQDKTNLMIKYNPSDLEI